MTYSYDRRAATDTTIYYGNELKDGLVIRTSYALPLVIDPRKLVQRMSFGIWKATGDEDATARTHEVASTPSKSGYPIVTIWWQGNVTEAAVTMSVGLFLKKEGRKAGYRVPSKQLASASAVSGV